MLHLILFVGVVVGGHIPRVDNVYKKKEKSREYLKLNGCLNKVVQLIQQVSI